jgi:hypothetical protein
MLTKEELVELIATLTEADRWLYYSVNAEEFHTFKNQWDLLLVELKQRLAEEA